MESQEAFQAVSGSALPPAREQDREKAKELRAAQAVEGFPAEMAGEPAPDWDCLASVGGYWDQGQDRSSYAP